MALFANVMVDVGAESVSVSGITALDASVVAGVVK